MQKHIKSSSKRKSDQSFINNLHVKPSQDFNNNSSIQLEKEMNSYLLDAVVNNELEPVLFFKGTYPLLYAISRGLLSIPATSVPSESLLSGAGLVATSLRNKLSPEQVENLVF